MGLFWPSSEGARRGLSSYGARVQARRRGSYAQGWNPASTATYLAQGLGGDHPGPLVMGPPVPRGGYRLELRGRPLSSTTEETGWGQPRHQGSGPGTEGRDHHTAQSRQLAGGRLWAVRHVPGTDGGMCSLSLCALCVCVRGCVLSQRFDCESRERYLERTTRALATQCTQCTQCNGRNVKRPPRLHRRVVSLEGRRATA